MGAIQGGITIQYGGTKTIGECVEEFEYELNTRLRTVANCEVGILRFFYGSKPERTMRLPLPEDQFRVGPATTDRQFQMLCPRMAERYNVEPRLCLPLA